jgi:hypothetical protein
VFSAAKTSTLQVDQKTRTKIIPPTTGPRSLQLTNHHVQHLAVGVLTEADEAHGVGVGGPAAEWDLGGPAAE